jgi:hypothetical protein
MRSMRCDVWGRREAYAIGACPVIGYKTVSVKSCGNTDRSCATAALLLPREHLNLANPSDSARNIRSVQLRAFLIATRVGG